MKPDGVQTGGGVANLAAEMDASQQSSQTLAAAPIEISSAAASTAKQAARVRSFWTMSPAGTYLDFARADLLGAGMWTHVIRGAQTFVVVPPSTHNTALYEHWVTVAHSCPELFGDLADSCYRIDVHEGQTLVMPAGWIYAIYVSTSSAAV